jgi:hypothetical protein
VGRSLGAHRPKPLKEALEEYHRQQEKKEFPDEFQDES